MALQPYTVTVPRGQEHLLPSPMPRREPIRYGGGGGGGGMGAAATKAFAEAEAYYGPEGGFGKGVLAGLERERAQAMSSGMQALVGSGFAGTTMAGGLGKKFAEEIGMPTRMRVEETRAERLSAIKMLRAQLAQASTESARQRISQELMARMSAETQIATTGMGIQASLASGQLGAETSLATARLGARTSLATAGLGARTSLATAGLGAETSLATTGMREAGAMERLVAKIASERKTPFTPPTFSFDDDSPFAGLGPMEQTANKFNTFENPMAVYGAPTEGTFAW